MKLLKSTSLAMALACLVARSAQVRGATTPGQGIILSGTSLATNQGVLGSWPAEPDYTGPIIAGMGNSYLVTGTSAYQSSSCVGGNYILSTAGGNYLGDEAYGLTIASQLNVNPLNNSYRSALTMFYNVTVPNSAGGTSGYATRLLNSYTNSYGEQSQAVIYLAEHTVAAAYVNAVDLPAWRSALIGALAQVNDNDFFPVQSAGAALWALAKTGPLNSTPISSSGFWGGKTLSDLPGIVASRQITSGTGAGSFYANFGNTTGGYSEDAVYALLGLAAADPIAYRAPVLAAKNWTAASIIASGANKGLLADNPALPGTILCAYTGEGLQALTAPFAVTWNGATGNWSEAAKWSINPNVPDDNFDAGIFYDVTVNSGVLTLDSNRVIRVLTVNGGSLAGAANLQVSGGMINGSYNVTGTTTALAGTLIFGGAAQNAGPINGGGNLLVNAGSTLSSDGISVNTLTVLGAAQIRPNGTSTGTSKVNTLTIAHTGAGPSANYTGSLNLANNKLIVQSTNSGDKTAKIANLNEAISVAANGGSWNGKGISSSTAAADANHLSIGVFDNALLGLSGFGGNNNADSGSILVSVAHLGDANYNGVVDIQDQSIITNHWQSPQNNWAAGDLNRDGFVDLQDLTLVTNNWQQGGIYGQPASLLAMGGSGQIASVPEPASLALIVGVGLVLLRRPAKCTEKRK